jgi:hypothetical protein
MGLTALMIARMAGHENVAEKLLAKGAVDRPLAIGKTLMAAMKMMMEQATAAGSREVDKV